MNPSEKAPKEPPWITDVAAVSSPEDNMMIVCKDAADIQRLCDGETIHCELCGKPLPLWPPREWAQHNLDDHKGQYTVQNTLSMAQLVQSQFNQAQAVYFNAQLMTRVSMRRRAWKIGLTERAVLAEDAGSRILGPRGEKIQ